MPDQIQAVINTLQELDIKATYGNLDRLLGCIQVLNKVKEQMLKEQMQSTADNPEPDIAVDPEEDPVIEIAGGQR